MVTPRLEIVMRTVDRGIRPTYLARTLRYLDKQGIPASQIHVCPTHPDTDWITKEDRARSTVHEPARTYRSTENMGIALLAAPTCDWVVHLEDDIRPCADFLGSVGRWLSTCALERHRLATFFAISIAKELLVATGQGIPAIEFPLHQWTSSVAAAMRWEDAQLCGAWILKNARTWRVGPDFPDWATYRGADKMLAAWQAEAYPDLPDAVASAPCLVEHEGNVSSLSRFGRFRFVKAPVFTGQAWGSV